VYAFEKGKNIPTMAQKHVGKKVIVSVDLKDYFQSIKQYHLDQIFKHIGFGEKPARLLSELCTYKSFVPQGALTSPKLSNIITTYTFGPLIKDYCDERGYTLTIYADDITISSDNLVDNTGSDTVHSLISYLRETVERFGFRVNQDKTKVMKYYQRQYVCGAVVNSKVNLQKTERNTLRAIIHNCEVNGIEVEASKNQITEDEFISVMNGRLNWFNQLNPQAGSHFMSRFKEIYGRRTTNVRNSQDVRVEEFVSQDVNNVGTQQVQIA
jgi:retron-type reverse transcriptase